ncbi:Translin [Catenaria anguillulae PL171]|uniref:Translin n=1 Tax=Catenaria anguillulae PL171 TaxID=765915 RepID=A0A1Y2I180_9FUNG|nr:Translin [Catenaria anguillulae PL171]
MFSPSQPPESLFASLQQVMDSESDVRDDLRTQVRVLERVLRSLQTALANIHMDVAEIKAVATGPTVEHQFAAAKQEIAKLKALVPDAQFFRFYPMFSGPLQTACYLVALKVYLETEELVAATHVAEVLGVPIEATSNTSITGFHIPMEDFLFALALLPSELSRLAINSAAQRDFQRPARLLNFLQRLHGGFQLLNLKNDNLRRKYDSIKYDIKRVEEVVYNIKMRGLDVPAASA